MRSVTVQSNQLSLQFFGPEFGPFVLEAVTNVAGGTWTPLQTNTLHGPTVIFTDPNWTIIRPAFFECARCSCPFGPKFDTQLRCR